MAEKVKADAKKTSQAKKSSKKSQKKTGLKLFYPIYLLVVLLIVWGIFVGCENLAEVLRNYEASLPKYVAKDVAQMFMDRDFEKVYSYQDPADFAGEDAQTYAAYMREFTANGELTWDESYSSSVDEKVYAVRLDGKRLFEFTLCKSGTQDENGNDQWMLNEVRTLGISIGTRTVKAPTESTVYVDGVALDSSAIIEEGIALEDEDFLLGDEAESPTMCLYQYEVCLGEPQVRVVDAQGRENPLTVDANGNVEAARNSDSQIKRQVEDRVIEIVQAFAKFTSEDLSQSKMLKFVRKGTNGYEKIKNFDNNWFGSHSSYSFEDMTTDNYMIFSDDTFACDISFVYIIRYSGKDVDEVRYDTNYRFYFVERDDEWYLYDFKMVNQ